MNHAINVHDLKKSKPSLAKSYTCRRFANLLDQNRDLKHTISQNLDITDLKTRVFQPVYPVSYRFWAVLLYCDFDLPVIKAKLQFWARKSVYRDNIASNAGALALFTHAFQVSPLNVSTLNNQIWKLQQGAAIWSLALSLIFGKPSGKKEEIEKFRTNVINNGNNNNW